MKASKQDKHKRMKFVISTALLLGTAAVANANQFAGWQADPASDYQCEIVYDDEPSQPTGGMQ